MHSTYDYSDYDYCEDWDFKLWPKEDESNINTMYFTAKLSGNSITFQISLN